jgi:cell division protein FtsB
MTTAVADRPARTARSRDAAPPARRRSRRWIWLIWAVLAVGFAALVALFPTRTWLDKRAEADATEAELSELVEANTEMAQRIDALTTDDVAIEEAARRDHNMVRPGEESFRMLAPPVPSDLPSGWPYDTLRELVAP